MKDFLAVDQRPKAKGQGPIGRSIVYGLLVIVFLVYCTGPAMAQDIAFTAEVSSSKVALGSSVTLTVTISGTQNVNPPEIPDIDGFDVRYLGPSRQVSIVNGKYSSSIAFNYSLLPLKVGQFAIPDMTLTVSGYSYRTNPVAIEVVDSGEGIPSRHQAPALSLKDKIFLELRVPKKEVYVNEPLPVKIILFVNNLSVRDIQFPPALEQIGFTVREFPQPRQYQQTIKGLRYDIVEFDSIIYPTRIGEITVGPAEVVCNILFKNSGALSRGRKSLFNDDFFNSFFDRYEKKPITLKSQTAVINVMELPPKGKPKDFTGAVGQFDFDVSVSPTEVRVGDPITLKMRITGKGNLKPAQFPKFKDSREFKFYEPMIKKEKGVKSLEQVLIPKSGQVKEIPSLSFSYFNSDLKKYMTVTKGPFPVNVSELEQGDALKIVGLDGQENVFPQETLGQDIVFIKNNPGRLRLSGKPFYKGILYYMGLIIFLAGLVSAYIFHLHSHRVATDVVYARRLKAPRQARKDLIQAQKMIEAGKKTEFYDKIFKTLQEYLGNKFHLSSGAITLERMQNQFGSHQNSKGVLEKIQITFEECDMIRYASAKIDEQKMRESFRRVEEIIDFSERHIK